MERPRVSAEPGGDLEGRSYMLVTLGCFRNEVESDLVRSRLASAGMVESSAIDRSDVILVMTCGFIAEACDEGIDTMLELHELAEGRPVIALGCMAERYGSALLEEMPELAAVIGRPWPEELEAALLGALHGGERHQGCYTPTGSRGARTIDSSENATLLVRISDGCDRACRFCTIPSIRGPFASRAIREIVEEVERLAGGRYREVVLLAQDLASYGKDLTGAEGGDLASLAARITRVPSVRWLRLLYLQPGGVTDRLIEEVASNETICEYFDIPFQHASERVLRRMGRPGNAEEFMRVISRIRLRIPDASIRSTVMVGYPGESEEDFRELLTFVRWARLDWLGAFVFSPEEGTPAAELDGAVPLDVAISRYNMVVETQDAIEAESLRKWIGRRMEVVADDFCEIEPYDLVGRSYREAPVVDGLIYLRRTSRRGAGAVPGDFLPALITGHEGLDLVGEI